MQQIWIQVRIFFGNKFEPHAFKINVWRVTRNIFLIYGNEMPNDPNLTGRDFLSHIIKCKTNWQVLRQFNCSSWCLFTYGGSNCFSTMEKVQIQANCKPVPLIWKVFELGDRAYVWNAWQLAQVKIDDVPMIKKGIPNISLMGVTILRFEKFNPSTSLGFFIL